MPDADSPISQLELYAPYRRRGAGRIRGVKFQPVCNYYTKPLGGIWTSRYTPDAPAESDWIAFCRSEHPDFIPAYGYLYAPAKRARIYTIASRENLHHLLSHYCFEHREGRVIDFEAASRDFDAIHLAEASIGQETEFSPLYLWDCECTLWFSPQVLEYFGRIRLRRGSVAPHPVEGD